MSVHVTSILEPEAPELGVLWSSPFQRRREYNTQKGPSTSTPACVEMDRHDVGPYFLKQTLCDLTKTFRFELL